MVRNLWVSHNFSETTALSQYNFLKIFPDSGLEGT